MNPPTSQLTQLLSESVTVVCCGSGGVGKTTVAAAMALEGARSGKRTCVVTIDPARRLADALGLDSLSNTPSKIRGDWPGELWGLMLDPKSTFDDLVRRYAADSEQAEGILSNRLYRNLSDALSGTHEYMAMEKLFELHDEARFDLIVVDTPPTRNALDFIDAPRRLTRFLDNRFFRILITPTRAYLRAVSVATQAFLRTVSRVVGAEVVKDAVVFFQAFGGMEEGFRDRANQVMELLSSEGTSFVLVASPRGDALGEAAFFAEKLEETGVAVKALVMNRMHPRFANRAMRRVPADGGRSSGTDNDKLAVLRANLADFESVADREEAHLTELAAKVDPAPVVRVPFLAEDVHDISGLDAVALHLFSFSHRA